jgi:hypothetical protein
MHMWELVDRISRFDQSSAAERQHVDVQYSASSNAVHGLDALKLTGSMSAITRAGWTDWSYVTCIRRICHTTQKPYVGTVHVVVSGRCVSYPASYEVIQGAVARLSPFSCKVQPSITTGRSIIMSPEPDTRARWSVRVNQGDRYALLDMCCLSHLAC